MSDWKEDELPPVGVRIQAIGEHNQEWFDLEIVAMHESNAWIIDYSFGDKRNYIICIDSYKFRPLKTEEEKAISDIAYIIRESWTSDAIELAEYIYLAGYRKT